MDGDNGGVEPPASQVISPYSPMSFPLLRGPGHGQAVPKKEGEDSPIICRNPQVSLRIRLFVIFLPSAPLKIIWQRLKHNHIRRNCRRGSHHIG